MGLFLPVFFMLGSVLMQAQGSYSSAIHAYQQGQYGAARDSFLMLEQQGYSDAPLYYNLGNTFYALNDLGRAILYYERALKQEPDFLPARQNLTLAKSKCEDDYLEVEDFFAWRWLKSAAQRLGARGWMWASIGTAWILIGLLVAYWWQKITWRRFIITVVLAGLVWTGVTALGWLRHYLDEHLQEAVVIPAEAALRIAPDEQSAEVLTLHAGLKITLLDTLNGWHKIQLPNKETGWIKQHDFIKI